MELRSLHGLPGITALLAMLAGCTQSLPPQTLQSQGSPTARQAVAAMAPDAGQNGGSIREYDDLLGKNSNYNPLAVAYGPGGDLWIADNFDPDFGESAIVRVSAAGKHLASYPTGSTYGGIAAGPDGALWVTDSPGAHICRLGTDGTYTCYSLKINFFHYPNGITAGPDGALWFTATSQPNGYVGRITTSGSVTIYGGLSQHSWPEGIATGPDGNLWFAERDVNRIGRITPSGVVTEFSKGISKNASPYSIAAGSDGALWFTEEGGAIGRITTSGEVTEYHKGISQSEHPFGLALGSDGAMWFTEYTYGHRVPAKIARITTGGTVAEYGGIDPHSFPQGITAGPRHDLWFVEGSTDLLGRVHI
jgi:streptogramin lyase